MAGLMPRLLRNDSLLHKLRVDTRPKVSASLNIRGALSLCRNVVDGMRTNAPP
jgi:hypothetical protein